MERREFLKAAGLMAAGSGFWPDAFLPTLAAGQEKATSANAKETLDALLEKYRRHQRTGLHAGPPGGGNHIPMTLIAAYRMGAGPETMQRYIGHFKLRPEARPIDKAGMEKLTQENWRDHLGKGEFFQFVEFFDDWARKTSVDAVLKKCMPVLAEGLGGAFSHDLIRLAYAIDYNCAEEIAFSLAGLASGHQPSLDFEGKGPPVEPDALLSEIVKNTSALQIKPYGGRSGPIAFRLGQVYASKEFSGSLKPVRVPEADPLAKISEVIMEVFTQTHDFTLLHVLTTCQAMRSALPFVGDPRKSLSAYWYSACAAYITVVKARSEVGKDSVAGDKPDWKELHSGAAAAEVEPLSAYEHTVKLTYSCWQESQHYKRDRYLALASREIKKPSRFV
jgi:hypothetical protein